MNTPIEIPNKSLFKMNEVCGLTGVKPYVLRFWESEFDEIEPVTSSSGQKLYEHKDIEAIALIKKLLFEDKMTVEAARANIKTMLHSDGCDSEVIEENNEAVEVDQSTAAPIVRAGFSENDIQKLVMAKQKLGSVLEVTELLKKKNNW